MLCLFRHNYVLYTVFHCSECTVVSDQVMMYERTTVTLGTVISINCSIIQGKSGVYIETPLEYTINSNEITFNATIDDMETTPVLLMPQGSP